MGSYRYGILHLAAADAQQLRLDCERASALLGWPAPYADRPVGIPAVVSGSAPTGADPLGVLEVREALESATV